MKKNLDKFSRLRSGICEELPWNVDAVDRRVISETFLNYQRNSKKLNWQTGTAVYWVRVLIFLRSWININIMPWRAFSAENSAAAIFVYVALMGTPVTNIPKNAALHYVHCMFMHAIAIVIVVITCSFHSFIHNK